MKLKLVTYIIAFGISMSAFMYARPDFRRQIIPQGASASKPVPAAPVKKADIKLNKKNHSHQFKSRLLNTTRPFQRCIKTLKI